MELESESISWGEQKSARSKCFNFQLLPGLLSLLFSIFFGFMISVYLLFYSIYNFMLFISSCSGVIVVCCCFIVFFFIVILLSCDSFTLLFISIFVATNVFFLRQMKWANICSPESWSKLMDELTWTTPVRFITQ